MTISSPTSTVPAWVVAVLRPFLESHLGAGWLGALREWRFASRYFSSVIIFRVEGQSSLSGRFVAKFPKVERGRGFSHVPERRDGDLELAAQEYAALEALAERWPQGETAYVRPRFYHPPSGMLVFDYLEGRDLYRRSLPFRLATRSVPSHFLASLRTLGHALAVYHTRTAAPGQFDFARLIAKIDARAKVLRLTLPRWLSADAHREAGSLVPAIKGFELRNTRIAQDRIWLFDPGRLRPEPPEADLARFLLSLWICGWGTPFFPFALDARPLVHAFTEGYIEQHIVDERALRVFLLREILWNWREGREALADKGLLRPVSALLTQFYVEFPFRRLWRSSTLAPRVT